MTISLAALDSNAGIVDNVDAILLQGPYRSTGAAVINLHGFTLLWIGISTAVGGILISRASVM